MSWLNLNSLNNIKGQLTNFASGVLADGIVNDTGTEYERWALSAKGGNRLKNPFTELSSANQKIQELQNLCASQEVEIGSLRRQNAEFYEKISFSEKSNSVHDSNGDANGENWFWDPPTSDTDDPKIDQQTAQRKNSTNSTISDLNNRITNLETEKKELILSLDQLDLDCQNTTDKLVTLKDNLQTEYTSLKNDYEIAKTRIESLETQNLQYKSKLGNSNSENNSKFNQSDHKTELELAKTQIATLETQNSQLNSKLSGYQHEIETLKQLDTKLNQANLIQELELAKSQIVALETQTVQLNVPQNDKLNSDDYNDLKTKFESCQLENNNFETLLNDSKLEIEHLKAINSQKLDSQPIDDYNELKSKFDSLLDEKNNLESKFNENKTQFNNLKVEFNSLNSKVEVLKSDTQKYKQFDLQYTDLESKHSNTLSKLKDLNNELNDLKMSKTHIEVQNSELELKNKELLDTIGELNNEVTELKLNKNNFEQTYSKVELKNVEALDTIKDLEAKIKELKLNKQSNFSDDHKNLQDKFDELVSKFNDLNSEKQELHKKYVSILTENVKKYVDYEIPNDFIQKRDNNDLSEFNSKVETVLKLLLDFKWRTETLEKKLCEISHEKAVAVSEKNHEIEKLLNNSEILSQEVITKTQTINHYEIECTELIKNNDLLIAELQKYKSNGLQTISETNEDNLLQLENQLEISNKRIRELRLVINDMENAKQEIALETQSELDYIKKQLNMTGKELSQSKKEHQELLNMFKQLEFETQNLNSQLTHSKAQIEQLNHEKIELDSSIDKFKSDVEHSEYKFTEANFDLEALNEELSTAKQNINELTNSNLKLNKTNADLSNKISLQMQEIDNLKLELQRLIENTGVTSNLELQKTNLELKIEGLNSEIETNKLLITKLENDNYKYGQLFTETQSYFQKYAEVSNVSLDDLNIVEKLDYLKNCTPNTTKDALLRLELENSELQSVKQELNNNVASLKQQVLNLESSKLEFEHKFQLVLDERKVLENSLNNVKQQLNELKTSHNLNSEMVAKLHQFETEIKELNASKAELVDLVTRKHQESLQYHAEIQRLNAILTEAELSKDSELNVEEFEKVKDQNSFLKDKCEKLTQNLLNEQSNTQRMLVERNSNSDKEQMLVKELERLRIHLVEIEDTYTQELILAEQKNQEMLAKMTEIEQRERDSSTIYTSVSIRANQQVETLQTQLQLVTTQRDEFQKKNSEAEDKNHKQVAALTNLQCVLEQFQRDRQSDIINETERIRRQINVEKLKQNELLEEINSLRAQLEESKQGLKAAARLTEQMEKSKQQVVTMKDEVQKLQDQLSKTEEKYKFLLNQTEAKVDKILIRNLIIGFISSNHNQLNTDQTQILKIISTVLDFSPQDSDKLKLQKPNSWLGAILHPMAGTNISQQSLSEAFVRFLENESQPKQTQPPLINVRKMSTESNASTSSSKRENTLLSDVVLPTFADFAQNRNSSSILKDVLKEN